MPSEYSDLPQLKGRASVEMTLRKPDGEQFDIEGKLYKEAKMKMIIDGYTGKLIRPRAFTLVHAMQPQHF